jgi:uncharacterized protein
MSTEAQLLALPTAPLDEVMFQLTAWFVFDKANTLFAFLFGLGFYLQMSRLTARGVDFERVYLRRLTVLLVFGILHTVFLWCWDILQLYALAGFLLFALRGVSDRALLAIGLPLALVGRSFHEFLTGYLPLESWHGYASQFSDAAVLNRQALSQSGDYVGLIRAFGEFTLTDWLLNGAIVGWLAYVLGRFLIGAWVGRRGWLQDIPRFLDGFRRVRNVALPAGLLAEGILMLVRYYGRTGRLPEWPHWVALADALHLLTVLVLAAGYLSAIVVGLHSPGLRRWLAPFRHAGRMALTNYVAQSVFYGLVLFGVGPGLALGGKIGVTQVIVIVTLAYAAQIALSRLWLQRFRYGPLEWVWRRLTYGAL